MKIIVKMIILGLCCLIVASAGYCQESKKTPYEVILELNSKGYDYFYTNIPGTHIYLRLVSSRNYGYSGLLYKWSNGAECLINEYYGFELEKTIKHYQSIGANTARQDTVLNGRKAVILKGERQGGVIANTLILSSQKRIAAILLQYPKGIPESEIEIFQEMLYSMELHPEASIDTATAMSIAPFTIDWKKVNNMTELNKKMDLMELETDKNPPQPLVFYGMNEGFYEFTMGGQDPGNVNTPRIRIQHTLKSDFEGNSKAYLQQCMSNYGLDSKTTLNAPIKEQEINGDKVLSMSFSFQFEGDEIESNYMLYIYEDKEKFLNLLVCIKPSNDPLWLLYTSALSRNFAKAIKIRTL